MTAIITVLAKDSVYHVSDRLVSVPNLQPDRTNRRFLPYDSAANKSIIYVGKDCRLVLGYTGQSHIGNKPTDRWLAELIRGGREMPEQSEGAWPPIGDMRSAELLTLLTRNMPDGLTITIGGYLDTAYGKIPRLWTIYRDEIVQSHDETSAVAIPKDAATIETYREIEFEINSAPAHLYADALVRAMRKVSLRNSLVGPDFMVVRVCRDGRRFEIGMHPAESPTRGKRRATPHSAYSQASPCLLCRLARRGHG